jgi:hypothetical protein
MISLVEFTGRILDSQCLFLENRLQYAHVSVEINIYILRSAIASSDSKAESTFDRICYIVRLEEASEP